MSAAVRADAEMEKMKDQIAKERDPQKRAELQKRLSSMKGGQPQAAPSTGACCGGGASPAKPSGKKH